MAKTADFPEICDSCGEETVEPYECPGCGRRCCGERCITGKGVLCIECEEGGSQ